MLVIISPAKKLDMEPIQNIDTTTPKFLKNAKEIVNIAQNLNVDQLRKLSNVSVSIAEINFERFKLFGKQMKKQAAFAFAGDTYKGLDIKKMNHNDVQWAQEHLRILSGLYGMLRPLDLIEPYRLEMGSKLQGFHGGSLYEYWDDKISVNLNHHAKKIGTDTLVNCASNEYFNAIKPNTISLRVITPIFMERKNGQEKIISFYAKNARGSMARFIIQNRLVNYEEIKKFNLDGYAFNSQKSDENKFIFIREN